MKKLIVVTALILFAGIAFGQVLKKGMVVGTHVFTTVELKPNVTENQYLEFMETKFKPVYEKNFEGVKVYTLRGIKGKQKGKLGALYVIEDEASFMKYFPPDGNVTREFQAAWDKVQPVYEELLEMQENIENEFTDWIVLF